MRDSSLLQAALGVVDFGLGVKNGDDLHSPLTGRLFLFPTLLADKEGFVFRRPFGTVVWFLWGKPASAIYPSLRLFPLSILFLVLGKERLPPGGAVVKPSGGSYSSQRLFLFLVLALFTELMLRRSRPTVLFPRDVVLLGGDGGEGTPAGSFTFWESVFPVFLLTIFFFILPLKTDIRL